MTQKKRSMARTKIFRILSEEGYGRVYRDKNDKIRFAQKKRAHISLRFNGGYGVRIFMHPQLIREKMGRLNQRFASAENVDIRFGHPKQKKRRVRKKSHARSAPHR